ncbi:sensor histidine kinase [Salinibacterium sp. ZJ450]|uniref:sensor histidine kinase n=1 Tax=Salinibacterium sp. ZJ450 TaxID=2708338 RepID=UPI00141E8480|nr:histidine kinase [Salinibacterium sp. ZJ450]
MGAVGGLVAVVTGILGGLLHAVNAAADRVHTPSFWFMGLATAIAYGAVSVVLRRSDAVWIRRVTAAIGASSGLALLAMEWAWLGAVPLAGFALWIGSWLWVVAYVAILSVLPHVLPRGEVTSPRWRPALWLSVATLVVASTVWAITPYDQQDFPLELRELVNPIGMSLATHPVTVIGVGVLLLVSTALAIASLAARWRRSGGLARQQLKWLLLGAAGTLVLAGLARAFPAGPTEVIAGLAMLPVPIALGIAVLRHGLWEIDVVISRSITYAALSAAVIVVYLTSVWLLGSILGDWTGAPVVATALAALVALPLHARLQRWVNLRVHGDVEEPHVALARLGDRLAAASDPQELSTRVLPAVVEQVTRSLRASGARLVLVDGTTAVFGNTAVFGDSIETDVATGVARVSLTYGGLPTGELMVHRPGGLDASDHLVLARLATQAGVAAHTVLLAHEVQRAREAVVVAREEERRQLRRDLHDDIGPALAAVALQAEAALKLAVDDPDAAAALIARLAPRLNQAVGDVRALVHELRPPTLDEFGLAASVHELAARMSTPAVPVTADVPDLAGLSAALDVAAYRIVAEAVTNAVRHAGGSSVQVRLAVAGGNLEIEVFDDGRGLPAEPVPGLGLTSMRLRAEELGGELCLATSALGTRLSARIPLATQVPAERPVPTRLPVDRLADTQPAGRLA